MQPDTKPSAATGPWALLSAGIAFGIYVYCLPPVITGEDAGELVTAAATLGVPHPPGYPTWTLYAHVFTWLPWGSMAWRVALSSAFAAAAAVGLLCALFLRLTGSRSAALGASLTFAFTYEFWEQAIIPEVYALNACCLAASLLALCPRPPLPRFRPPRTYRRFGFGYGVALGVHNTLWLLGPVFALYVLYTDGRREGRWRTYALATCCALLGACVFLYLPWASARNPAVDWGNPETLSNFFSVVRRDQYAFMMTESPHSLARFLAQARIMAGMAVPQFTPWVGVLCLLGLPWMLRRHPAFTLLVTGSGLLISAAFILAQNFTYDAEWLWVMSVFQIPLYMAGAMGLAGTLAFVAAYARKTAVFLALLCIASPLVAHWSHNDRAQDRYVLAFAQELLDTLPQEAVFVPTADHESFPVLYLQAVQGQRPDVTLARKYGYLEMALWKDMPGVEQFGAAPPRRHDPELIAWLAENGARPVYITKPFALPEGSGLRFTRHGLLYQLEPNTSTSKPTPPSSFPLPPADTTDYTGKLIRLDVELAWANDRINAGDRDGALARVRAAALLFPGDPRIGNNLGTWCARHGFPEQAAYLFRSALHTAESHLPDDPATALLREHLQRIGSDVSITAPI